MPTPRCLAKLLEKLAQLCRRDTVMNFAANAEIGALHALVLAEFAGQVSRGV
jgi:hypothetical protein